MRTRFVQPTGPDHLGENLARVLRPAFFAAVDDLDAAIAAADSALALDGAPSDQQRIDDRIEVLRAELALLEAAREAS